MSGEGLTRKEVWAREGGRAGYLGFVLVFLSLVRHGAGARESETLAKQS